MGGMNVSVSGGIYTYSNLGPITTTFTPPPTCTASDQLALATSDSDYGYFVWYSAQCTATVEYTDCVPTTTAEPTQSFLYGDDWYGYGQYYSPGLYCPKGWKTVGMAARDASSVLTSSGLLVPTTTTTTTSTRTPVPTPYGDDYDEYEDYDYEDYDYDDEDYYTYEDPVSVLMTALEPKQTMALCCPEHMTADQDGACYSVVEDYKPTTGCNIQTEYDYEDYDTTVFPYTRTFVDTYRGETTTEIVSGTTTVTLSTPTATHAITMSTTLDAYERRYLTGIYWAPVITILHHETDFEKVAEESKSAEAAADASESPSNAAGRLTGNSVWEGVGTVMGIWAVAAILGGVMVLPW
ncbi:hypothetical protein BDW74DRAFT_153468 [Aspergillus multicolor]|uniref:uncharacterized protein n=1 Tax=Aspergillus multicolor TaxID=41759 RepID=UPI003CCDE5A2